MNVCMKGDNIFISSLEAAKFYQRNLTPSQTIIMHFVGIFLLCPDF